jgi:hypothetical protein
MINKLQIFSNFRDENEFIYAELRKLFSDKPITFFYDYIPQKNELNLNPYNFIMLSEPDEFFGMQSWVKNHHYLFTGILTWSNTLLNECDNAILFHHNSNNLDNDYVESFKDKNKQFEISFLSGAKNLVEGHKLRQEIYQIKDQITIPKKWFYVLDDFNQEDFDKGGIGRPKEEYWLGKQICFKDSMFHVAVENVKHDNWYTEKIGDAFSTKTIPLYWGCPNLGDLGYDERGIIRFSSIPELIDIINNLTVEKYYEMKPYVDYNYEVIKLDDFKTKLITFFDEFCKFNNI